MINELLSKCEDAINSKPCGYCGKMHSVSLTARGTENRTILSYAFSDDSCQEFQYAVKQFVACKFAEYDYPVTIV